MALFQRKPPKTAEELALIRAKDREYRKKKRDAHKAVLLEIKQNYSKWDFIPEPRDYEYSSYKSSQLRCPKCKGEVSYDDKYVWCSDCAYELS